MTASSPHWEERKAITWPFRSGFPYNEGFPAMYVGQRYTLITADGQHHYGARVDPSTQYRAEGLRWLTADNISVSPGNVIAWCKED
jgi:hypothetical protein